MSVIKVVALNTGSSSLKFACYQCSEVEEILLYKGSITRIGQEVGHLVVKVIGTDDRPASITEEDGTFPTIDAACKKMFAWIETQPAYMRPDLIGHRVVHGGPRFSHPCLITEDVMTALEEMKIYAPEHIPPALKTIQFAKSLYPELPNVACFDTAFHRTMPEIAQTLPIPKIYRDHGLQKYGFHGLSYEFLLSELVKLDGLKACFSRVLFAHLGHGASLAAVKDGKCIDTTMGFSPTGGFPMTTRSGDLDPEVLLFLLQHEHVPIDELKDILNKQSGVLALSERSDDFRDLLAWEETDPKCHLAVDYFCYHLRKAMGAMIAGLKGLDILVFSAGIGEHSPEIRRRICHGLAYLGVELDDARNERDDAVISNDRSKVLVRVIRTDEEKIIAHQSYQVATKNSEPVGNESK